MTKHKFFNEKKYYLSENRWFQTSGNRERLSHDIWEFYHPSNPIQEDEVIHHINRKSEDDRIENLCKMKSNEHNSLHYKNENNPNWKGGISLDRKAYSVEYAKQNYVSKTLFRLYDNEEKFCLSLRLKYNQKTEHEIYTTEWNKYYKKKYYSKNEWELK